MTYSNPRKTKLFLRIESKIHELETLLEALCDEYPEKDIILTAIGCMQERSACCAVLENHLKEAKNLENRLKGLKNAATL